MVPDPDGINRVRGYWYRVTRVCQLLGCRRQWWTHVRCLGGT
jgi:hypothetical protein